MKTVFLLQDTKDANERLKENFDRTEDFSVCGTAEDGISAVAMVAERKPEFLITDIVLSGYDGISVVRKIKELGLSVKIIVLSALMREEVISNVIEQGADYFMAKPYNFNVLVERMREIGQEKNLDIKRRSVEVRTVSLDEKISKIFINVGIPPHIKGYSFLREGVKMAVADPEIINSITKKLYPSIGEKYKTTPSKVERAIRHAIEVAWNRGRIDSINSILGVRAYVGAEKPTNGEFIALVADKMLLERA